MALETTERWCGERQHPIVTYNPWLGRSYCRCGHRQEPGEQPTDWEAKRAVFHTCLSGGACRCYVSPGESVGPEHEEATNPNG